MKFIIDAASLQWRKVSKESFCKILPKKFYDKLYIEKGRFGYDVYCIDIDTLDELIELAKATKEKNPKQVRDETLMVGVNQYGEKTITIYNAFFE